MTAQQPRWCKIPLSEEVHVTFSVNKNNVMITLISVILILLNGHVQQKQCNNFV